MTLDNDSVVVASEAQLTAGVGDDAVVLSLVRSEYFGLNEVGARIWESLQEPQRVGALVDLVVQEFDVNEETCRIDITAFVEQLVGAGLAVHL